MSLRKGFLFADDKNSKLKKPESKFFIIPWNNANLENILIQMPTEIIHEIAKLTTTEIDGCIELPDITSISRLCRVCKHFYNVIWLSDLWKYFGQRIQRLALDGYPRITTGDVEEFKTLFCSDRVNAKWNWHYQDQTGTMNVYIDYKGRCFFGSIGKNIIINESHLPFQEYMTRAAKYSIHNGNKTFNLNDLQKIQNMYVLHIGMSGPTITLVSPSGLVVMSNYVTEYFPNMNVLFAPTIFNMKQKLAQLVMTEFGLTIFLGEYGRIYVVATMANTSDIYYRYGPVILGIEQVKRIVRKEGGNSIGTVPFDLVTANGVVETNSGDLFRECLDKALKKKAD